MGRPLPSSLALIREALGKDWYSTELTFVLKTKRWSELVFRATRDFSALRLCLVSRLTGQVLFGGDSTFPVTAVGSNGRCNTIWYKAVFKGGVYETRETVWAFGGAETRRVASLEGGADVA